MLLSKSSDEKASAQKQEGATSHKNSMQSSVATKIPPMPNNTGIPQKMKESFEAMSGCNFDDVRVHYSSEKPVQYQAFAYTQGNQVYIRPGQEQYLRHELGHVEQQKLGMVRPTRYENNVGINDDTAMEKQADTGFIHSGHGREVASHDGLIQCAPDSHLIAALEQIEKDEGKDTINETAAEFERITQEGRIEAGFEKEMRKTLQPKKKKAVNYDEHFTGIIDKLSVVDLKQIPPSVVEGGEEEIFLKDLKAIMNAMVKESENDRVACLQSLETVLPYFRDNAVSGDYIHPQSFIFDITKHDPVDKTKTPQAKDTPLHKALDNLPYVMAQDPNVSKVLGQQDAAHKKDERNPPVVTGQALKEALTARTYAKQANLKSYDRSPDPKLDFQGIDADGNLVYFDPFNLPEIPELYDEKATSTPEGKDRLTSKYGNQYWSTYMEHTVAKSNVAKGILQGKGKPEEKPTIPYTGVLDETYSPHAFKAPTLKEIEEEATKKKLAPSEVKPAVVVKVPLAEEFAKEHLLVERYYKFVQEQMQAHPAVADMDEATKKKILPELNRRVIQSLEEARGNVIYTLSFQENKGAEVVNGAIEGALAGALAGDLEEGGTYEKFYGRVTDRVSSLLQNETERITVRECVLHELERTYKEQKYDINDIIINRYIFSEIRRIEKINAQGKKNLTPD